MSKVRINDLARELEVKSKAILDVLQAVGVTEKKTHSSSLEDFEAEKVRVHFRASAEAAPSARSARNPRGEDEIKTKIDLSHITRPGDVLKAITQRKEAASAPPVRVAPPVAHPPAAVSAPPIVSKPAVAPPPVAKAPAPFAPSASSVVAPPAAPPVAPRLITPSTIER